MAFLIAPKRFPPPGKPQGLPIRRLQRRVSGAWNSCSVLESSLILASVQRRHSYRQDLRSSLSLLDSAFKLCGMQMDRRCNCPKCCACPERQRTVAKGLHGRIFDHNAFNPEISMFLSAGVPAIHLGRQRGALGGVYLPLCSFITALNRCGVSARSCLARLAQIARGRYIHVGSRALPGVVFHAALEQNRNVKAIRAKKEGRQLIWNHSKSALPIFIAAYAQSGN